MEFGVKHPWEDGGEEATSGLLYSYIYTAWVLDSLHTKKYFM